MALKRSLTILLLLGLALLQAGPAWAQVDTGRHRPVRPQAEEPVQRPFVDSGQRWFVMTGAGLLASGDLFRVRAEGTVGFEAPGGPGFLSNDFVVTVDETIDLAVALGYRLRERFWLRANLSTAQAALTALARTGQGAEVHRWDQLNLLIIGLDVEFRLVKADSYPFLLAGSTAVLARGVNDDDLDQDRLAWRFGFGYQQGLLPAWGLRAEIRNNLVNLDFGSYRPPVATDELYPNLAIEDQAPHHFWELLLLLHGSF